MAQSHGAKEEHLPSGTVIVAGGGPVGLLLAKVLSSYGIKSVLFERNHSTTRWPKMDLTNARSMEILRRLDLVDKVREIGVPSHIPLPVFISSGLHSEKPIARWDLPSVDAYRKLISDCNDGTQPLEPYQRVSQVMFEKLMKTVCEEDSLIDVRFGWQVKSVEEHSGNVKVLVANVDSGQSVTVVGAYLAGCDGSSSCTRKALGLALDGGPIPACALLVHFKSKDLSRLHKHGQFWHLFSFSPTGDPCGAVIAQDEVDTWTSHLFLPLDIDASKIDAKEAVYTVLGGVSEKYLIEIDEVLVRSVWRPHLAVARQWAGPENRVFIAGDAAHQNIPSGGYGMNTGIGDAYDLGWKLAAVINGYAGPQLLKSYEQERRPVSLRNVEHSGAHFKIHQDLSTVFQGEDFQHIDDSSDSARQLQAAIKDYYEKNDGENKDVGIEMDFRHESSVIVPEPSGLPPSWSKSKYTPSTWPGARAPHVFLSDGTPLYDKLGQYWTLLIFHDDDSIPALLAEAATDGNMPLKVVNLANEAHAKALYERPMVILRPDHHVAWRAESVDSLTEAKKILAQVTGHGMGGCESDTQNSTDSKPQTAFTSTKQMRTQVKEFELEQMGLFQQ